MGNQPSQTGNPQAGTSGGLQQPATSSLQTTFNQSVADVNNLDAGTRAIPLAGVPNTTSTASTPPFIASSPSHWLAYGGLALLVAVFLGVLSYKLLKSF